MSDLFGQQQPDIVGEIQAEKAYGPIYSAQYGDALRSARANELGHRLGIPADIVESDIPNMMARDRLDRAVAEARQNPAYAQVMANPRLAAAGIDDPHLPAVAKAVQQHGQTVDFGQINKDAGGGVWGALADIGAGTGVLATRVATGIGGLLSSVSGLAHTATDLADYNGLPLPYFGPGSELRLLGMAHAPIRQLTDASRVTTTNRNFNDVASGVEGVPTALAALAATTYGGPVAGAAVFGGQGMSDAYDEGRDAGLNPNQSALYGAGDAAISAGTMFLPEKYLGGVAAGKGGIAKTVGSGVGLGEVQTALQGLNHWYFIDKPKGVTFGQYLESLPDQLRSTLVSSMTMMGITVGAGHVVSKAANRVIDQSAADSVDRVMDASAKSSTRTSNPSDFEAALNQLVGDSGGSDIYVPADKVLDLFQPQEGQAQRDLRSDPFWGQYAPQIEEAGTLGGDVVVPLASAATHLAGTSDWAAIRDHVRTRPGGASRAEMGAAQSSDDLEAMASEIARTIDERVPQLKAQALTRQFADNLGYKGDQADAISSLLGAGLTRAHALETARSEAAGKPAPSMEDFAQSWLPEAGKTTQADYDAWRSANEGVTAEAAQALNQPVYHGSPHIFDKFSLDHIGTGEGAQAYGHGLYFAGKKEVAQHYKEALAQNHLEFPNGTMIRNLTIGDQGGILTALEDNLKELGLDKKVSEQARRLTLSSHVSELIEEAMYQTGGLEEARGYIDKKIANERDHLMQTAVPASDAKAVEDAWKDAKTALDGLVDAGLKEGKGRLYHVEIPDDGAYLLWDEPLSKQPQAVRDALAKVGFKEPPPPKPPQDKVIGGIINDALKHARVDHADIELTINNDSMLYNRAVLAAQKAGENMDDLNAGEWVVNQAKHYVHDLEKRELTTGEAIYRQLVGDKMLERGEGRPDKAISMKLRDAGIAGIKYLDGMSRSAGEGDHNYVLFDDRHARITDYEQALNDTQRRGNISIARDEQGTMTNAVIRAFEASDFSTAIHETGHFFLEDLKRRALGEGATDQERADWQAAKDWMTETGHTVEGDAVPEGAHEQFARGFERYIYEGKAPSQGLKAVFAKMRDFMVSLYRSVRSFNSPITPEIREVMDRLLASDDEINARRRELKLNDQALSDLMSEEENKRYAELGEEARSEARDKLYDRVLSTLRAEKTKEVSQRKSAIRQEISDQLDAQPIFRALKMLRSGRKEEDGSTRRVTLPRQWLVDNYGEEILDKLPKGVPPIVDDAHAVDPESLAQESGFDSADQMVRSLTDHEEQRQHLKASGDNRSPRRAAVETATDARLKAEIGDPMANLEEEADAALANDRQADRLSLELRALSRKTGKQAVPWKLAKDWANAHVRSATVRDAAKSVQMYAKNAATASHAVEEALAKKDYEAAFRAKQQQVLNLALMSEAKAAKDETIQAAKRLRKVAKAKTIASVDQDYLDQAHRLLENVDMKQRTDKAVDRRMAFEAWHAKQVEQEIDPIVPPEYQSLLGQTNWTKLSVNDLLDLDKAVKQIVKLGRLKQELKDGNRKRDFNEAVSEMQDRGGQVPPRKVRGGTTDPRKSPIGRAASRIRSIDAAMVKAEQLCIWLDHHDPNGPWQRYLYRPFAEAQGRQSDLTRAYSRELNALIKALPREALRSLTRKVDTPELVIKNNNHLSNGEAWKGTKDQVLMMALNWGNLGNRQRLLDGYGWSENAVASVFDRVLTKNDWDFVQGVWDTVDKLWPDVAKLERDVNGVEPEKVEPAEVPTPHGTYRGGYFPIVYDPMQTTHVAQASEDKMAPSGGWWSVTTRSSATKERSEQVKGRPLLLSLSVITHHMNEVIHDITHRQAVGQAKKLLGNDRVAAMINSRMGPEYLKATRAWVENIAKPNSAYSRENPAIVWLARYLNKAITTVGLGFRVGVSLKQLLGIPFSAKELGSPAVAKGMAIATAHPVQAYKEMLEKSPEMRARSDALDASIEDMHQDVANGKLKAIGPKGITKYAFMGITYMDVVSRTTVWTSAYNKALTEGMGEEDAIAFGDRAVRQSHGIGFQKDRAAIQYGHPFARALWPFFSYLNALYNAQRDVGHRVARAETAADYGEAARRAWWTFVVPALLSATLFGEGPDDDTVGGWAKYLSEQLLLGNVESLPVVGQVAQAIGKGYGYRAISYQQIGDSITKAVQEDSKIMKGDADVSGASIKHTLEAAGALFAKPLGQIGATSGGLYDYAHGEADPHTAGDWYNLLVKGRIPDHPTAAQKIAGNHG